MKIMAVFCSVLALVFAVAVGVSSHEKNWASAVVFTITFIFLFVLACHLFVDSGKGQHCSLSLLPGEGIYVVIHKVEKNQLLALVREVKSKKIWFIRVDSTIPRCFYLVGGRPVELDLDQLQLPDGENATTSS